MLPCSEVSFENLASLSDVVDCSAYPIHLQLDWISSYITSFQATDKIKLLSVVSLNQTEILGFLPLEVRKRRGTSFFSIRHFVPLASGPSDFFDIPCRTGFEKQVTDALVNWFIKHRHNWERLILNLIPESSCSWQPFVDALRTRGLSPLVTDNRKFYYIDTRQTWNSYEENYFYSKNRDLRKDLRRIERDGKQIRLVEIRSGLVQYLPLLFSYYGVRRIQKKQADVFEAPEWRNFLTEVIQKFETERRVSLNLLLDQNNEIWAHQLDWLLNGVRYHYFHSINEKFRAYSPGKVLLYMILKKSFEDPEIRQCNFMRGESPYKENFANQSENYITIEVHNPKSYRNKLLSLAKKVADFRDGVKVSA
jgi:CelD/BcsL family acetyltransferase involved in cellulose biosynthesis